MQIELNSYIKKYFHTEDRRMFIEIHPRLVGNI